jgi:hypothetical protein
VNVLQQHSSAIHTHTHTTTTTTTLLYFPTRWGLLIISKRNIKKIADFLLNKENDTHSETIYFLFISRVLNMSDTKIAVPIQIIKCRESTHSTRHIIPLKKKTRHITITEIYAEHINISIIYPQNIMCY